MIAALSRVTHLAADILIKLAAVGLILMTVIVGYQVFGRYVLNASPSWSEQAALTLMIWFVSFAAAAGVREGFHIRIVALEQAAGPKLKLAMRLFSETIVALCGVAMAIWGGELVARTWSHVIPSLGLPRGLAYLGLPISGVLIVLFAAERVIETLHGDKVENEEDPRWS